MSEHVLIVSDVAIRPLEFDRWQVTCSCGFIGSIVPEELADREAHEHREARDVEARISAAVEAEREACAVVAEDFLDMTYTPDRIAELIRARGGT